MPAVRQRYTPSPSRSKSTFSAGSPPVWIATTLVGKAGRLLVYQVIIRVETDAPDLLKVVLGVAFPQYNFEWFISCRKPNRLMKSPIDFPGLRGCFPFAVDAAETSRPTDLAGLRVDDFKKILATQRFRRLAASCFRSMAAVRSPVDRN